MRLPVCGVRLCKTGFPSEALYVCNQCLGPLEAVYDYDAARRTLTREAVAERPRNLWRYRELLPITSEPRTGLHSGCTPLVRAHRLGRELGVAELYLKDDSVNHPTLSYKDRVVPVAATRAVELGFDTLGCASTGNLGNSVAAHAARLGLTCYVFIPHDLEPGKILGSAVAGPHIVKIDGTLRRREPPVHPGWRTVRVGVRQHQPAQLLRRGGQDVRLRDRRAVGLALSAARRLAGRRRHPAAAHRAGVPRTPRGGAGRGRAAEDTRGPGGGMRTGDQRPRERRRTPRAGAARHHREVDRHRQPRRRSPGCSRPCGAAGGPGRGPPTRRSSTPSRCWRAPRASSPSRRAAPPSPPLSTC